MKKVAVVTGASRGIGAETACLLAANGYAVCVNYQRAQERAEAVVDKIKRGNGQAIAIKADVGVEEDVLHLFQRVDTELGPISALVNNAGINGGICEVAQITRKHLESVFSTNVFGPFVACREAIKRMKDSGGGSIVNISSEAAKFGGTQLTHYAASKAALNAFTIGCAREVAPFNIRMNTVSPGVIDTELHHQHTAERVNHLVKTIPMGRMGRSQEVAELIVWLLSDQASYISGAIIPITGAR